MLNFKSVNALILHQTNAQIMLRWFSFVFSGAQFLLGDGIRPRWEFEQGSPGQPSDRSRRPHRLGHPDRQRDGLPTPQRTNQTHTQRSQVSQR